MKQVFMNKLMLAASAIVAMSTVAASPAIAGSSDGKIQVKVLATGVLADGKITSVSRDDIGLPENSQTELSDNIVPTVAVEYYLSPKLSVETICCFTQHHLNGSDAIDGTRIVDHILVLPATVTAKYHFADKGPIRPYIGAGPAMYFYIDERPGATAKALGAERVKLANRPGLALQAGVDVPLNDKGFSLSFDAKRYFVKTKAHFYDADGVEVLTTNHKVSPWVLSGGIAYRF